MEAVISGRVPFCDVLSGVVRKSLCHDCKTLGMIEDVGGVEKGFHILEVHFNPLHFKPLTKPSFELVILNVNSTVVAVSA